MNHIELACAIREFELAFSRGSDPDHARKRHVVNPSTEMYYRAGFKAGQEAVKRAVTRYKEFLKLQESPRCAVVQSSDIHAHKFLSFAAKDYMEPNNCLLYPIEVNDECPNCHLGTIEKTGDDLYVCRGECGAFFRGPKP